MYSFDVFLHAYMCCVVLCIFLGISSPGQHVRVRAFVIVISSCVISALRCTSKPVRGWRVLIKTLKLLCLKMFFFIRLAFFIEFSEPSSPAAHSCWRLSKYDIGLPLIKYIYKYFFLSVEVSKSHTKPRISADRAIFR